jgi:hypothetical protein
MKHLTHTHNTSVSRCGTSYNRLRNNNSFELFKAKDFMKQYALFPEHCCTKCISYAEEILAKKGLPKLNDYVKSYRESKGL